MLCLVVMCCGELSVPSKYAMRALQAQRSRGLDQGGGGGLRRPAPACPNYTGRKTLLPTHEALPDHASMTKADRV